MYVARVPNRNSPPAYLLREGYREDGKVKSRTLAKGTVRCGDEGRGTLTLKPSSKVRRALARTKRSITATLSLRFAGAATDTQTVTFRGKS